MHAHSVIEAVGNTPLIELPGIRPEGGARIFVKWEGGNPTGSMKDRFALSMIRGARRDGLLDPGQRVVEYTGGSTGSSLAFVCAVMDHPTTMVTADCFAQEKIRTMRAFGAEVIVHETPDGSVYPGIIDDMMAYVEEVKAETEAYHTHQFENPYLLDGYTKMGEEILDDCPDVTDFVMSYGTGGCLTGNAEVLKPAGARITAVEPAESPLLSEGRSGNHHIEGIAVGVNPPIFEREPYDDVRAPSESTAREMIQRVAKTDGLFGGLSTGLNLAAAVEIANERDPDDAVVTVACDTGLKYLQGDLFAKKQ
ncbi:PLP-dependent cysteine synthase family protein [Haladaptatus sp. DYSN1]|uniref:PLP-dependent cysteine synthase family protein n=1 Tax=unclassified Haladaptatus TaxID=2622732 RepID=UPI0024065101|nr:PLP-dependent cysteine synthase family protein [Haladaptatus sp. DYSN1]